MDSSHRLPIALYAMTEICSSARRKDHVEWPYPPRPVSVLDFASSFVTSTAHARLQLGEKPQASSTLGGYRDLGDASNRGILVEA